MFPKNFSPLFLILFVRIPIVVIILLGEEPLGEERRLVLKWKWIQFGPSACMQTYHGPGLNSNCLIDSHAILQFENDCQAIGCSDGHHRCIVEIEDKPMLLLSTTAPQSNSQPSSMQNIACIYLSYPSPSQKDLEIIVTQSFERPKNLFSAAIFTWG